MLTADDDRTLPVAEAELDDVDDPARAPDLDELDTEAASRSLDGDDTTSHPLTRECLLNTC